MGNGLEVGQVFWVRARWEGRRKKAEVCAGKSKK